MRVTAIIWYPSRVRAHIAQQLLPDMWPCHPLMATCLLIYHVKLQTLGPLPAQTWSWSQGGNTCSSIACLSRASSCWVVEGNCSTSAPCPSPPVTVIPCIQGLAMTAMQSYHTGYDVSLPFYLSFHANFAQVGNNIRKSPKALIQWKIPTCGHN